jgi:hypothetical protein
VFYPTAIQTIVSNVRDKVKDNALWTIAILTLIFCMVQVGMTIGVSLYLRHDSAKMTIQTPVLTDVTALSAVKSDPSVLGIEKDIERLISEKNAAVSRSQNHSELQKLANIGNGWASGKLRERAKDAALPYDKQIAELRGEKNQISTTNSQIQLAAVMGANSSNSFKIDNYNAQSEHLANFLLYFAIAATIIECFAGLMLGLYKSLYGIGGITPIAPSSTIKRTVITPDKKEPVITDPNTVITDNETVITPENGQNSAKPVLISDSFVRELMGEIKADINNLKTGNGRKGSILDRIDRKYGFLLTIITDKNVSDEQGEKALIFCKNEIEPVLFSVNVAA